MEEFIFQKRRIQFVVATNQITSTKITKHNSIKMKYLISVAILLLCLACSSDEETITNVPVENEISVPGRYDVFPDNITVYAEESGGVEYLIVETDNIPNHPSPYFESSDSRYQAYNGDNSSFNLNPNRIASQNITMRIPMNPEEASTKQATPLGAIGISLNGVVFYNQYAGPNNQALTFEINSFDQFLGHPQQQGAYHYHQEPTYLTATEGNEALLGWLLDGFPVYGPVENGNRITNADLDAYHGHAHATDDYPDGIYHYHITDEDPYLNGSGFFGTPGTVSN